MKKEKTAPAKNESNVIRTTWTVKLTKHEHVVLLRVKETGMPHLAHSSAVTRGNVTRACGNLVDWGLIKKWGESHGWYKLTPLGKKILVLLEAKGKKKAKS